MFSPFSKIYNVLRFERLRQERCQRSTRIETHVSIRVRDLGIRREEMAEVGRMLAWSANLKAAQAA
jgi:hypothetical protein